MGLAVAKSKRLYSMICSQPLSVIRTAPAGAWYRAGSPAAPPRTRWRGGHRASWLAAALLFRAGGAFAESLAPAHVERHQHEKTDGAQEVECISHAGTLTRRTQIPGKTPALRRKESVNAS